MVATKTIPKVMDFFGNPLEPYQPETNVVRKVYHKGQPYWVLSDVSMVLGSKKPRGTNISRCLPKRLVRTVKVETPGGVQNLLVAEVQGLLWYASRTRTAPKEILKIIGRHRSTSLMSNWKETEVVDILFPAFSAFSPVRQFTCEGYKIDLYLEGPRIAIECDEHAHAHRGKQAEQKREETIRSALSCTFIRFNPDHPEFSVGCLIDSVIRRILDVPLALPA